MSNVPIKWVGPGIVKSTHGVYYFSLKNVSDAVQAGWRADMTTDDILNAVSGGLLRIAHKVDAHVED